MFFCNEILVYVSAPTKRYYACGLKPSVVIRFFMPEKLIYSDTVYNLNQLAVFIRVRNDPFNLV